MRAMISWLSLGADNVRAGLPSQCSFVPITVSDSAKMVRNRFRKRVILCHAKVLESASEVMTPLKLVSPLSGDLDSPTQNLVGLSALAAELGAEGVSVHELF